MPPDREISCLSSARVSLKAKCLMKQKEESKSQSGSQSVSPPGPLKKRSKTWQNSLEKRRDKKNKRGFKRQTFGMTKQGLSGIKPKQQSALTKDVIICSSPIIVTFVRASFWLPLTGLTQKDRSKVLHTACSALIWVWPGCTAHTLSH